MIHRSHPLKDPGSPQECCCHCHKQIPSSFLSELLTQDSKFQIGCVGRCVCDQPGQCLSPTKTTDRQGAMETEMTAKAKTNVSAGMNATLGSRGNISHIELRLPHKLGFTPPLLHPSLAQKKTSLPGQSTWQSSNPREGQHQSSNILGNNREQSHHGCGTRNGARNQLHLSLPSLTPCPT